MHALGTTLVWLCMVTVAFPLSPCAFLASPCHVKQDAAEPQAATEPVRSCCAEQSVPAEQPAPGNGEPCRGDCCRLDPIAPGVEKPLAEAQPLMAFDMLPLPNALAISPVAHASFTIAEAPPLQILHCQWRL